MPLPSLRSFLVEGDPGNARNVSVGDAADEPLLELDLIHKSGSSGSIHEIETPNASITWHAMLTLTCVQVTTCSHKSLGMRHGKVEAMGPCLA